MRQYLATMSDERQDHGTTSVKVVEAYVDYIPTFDFSRMTNHLLSTVPEKYLEGLGSIVLCNMSGMPRSERRGTLPRKKRRIQRTRVAGLYHYNRAGQKAWVQVYVDKIAMRPRFIRYIRRLREMLLAAVLYHEIGHHIHAFHPEFREKESVADKWAGRLLVNHLKLEYPLLYPPLKLLAAIVGRVASRKS